MRSRNVETMAVLGILAAAGGVSARARSLASPDPGPAPQGRTRATLPGKTVRDAHMGISSKVSLGSRGRSPVRAKKAPIIVLDPGHPSERNDGRRVVNGISEVRACWLVAVRLKELLRAAGVRVILTKRGEGEFVANRSRALIANRAQADLFLRLHCDSGSGCGFAVYYPDRRGKALGHVGPDPRVITASRLAAARFHVAMASALNGKLRDNGMWGDSKTYVGKRQGALTGSIFSQVPALTVEMCVLDNRADAMFISEREGREQIAMAFLAACLATVQ